MHERKGDGEIDMITERGAPFTTFSGIPGIMEVYFKNIQEEYMDRKRGESV
jgi:hypothetical protein